jgi:geranylgeranyl reductase family protein
MTNYDVIIIGAGPAGSTAARYCAHSNLKTLLLEKEKIPRYKNCAGGVTLGAVRELDFDIPGSLIEYECRGARLIYGKAVNEQRMENTVVYMVNRSRFDEFLVEKAVEMGAGVRESEPCLHVEPGDQAVTVQTRNRRYRANIVIGADGFYSTALKSLRGGFDKKEILFCVSADISLPESQIRKRFEDMVEIHYGYIHTGYAWMFPKGDYVSAGLGGKYVSGRQQVKILLEFLRMQKLNHGVNLRGCFLPVSRFKHAVYANRIMLAGDAAGFVNAFTGEGIRYAIASGRIAALTALSSHERDDFSEGFLKAYQDQCMESFGEDLRSTCTLTDFAFRFKRLFLKAGIKNDEVITHYLRTLTADEGFKEFSAWLKRRLPILMLKGALRLYPSSGRRSLVG